MYIIPVPLSQYFNGSHGVLYLLYLYFTNTNILETYFKDKITVSVQKLLVPEYRPGRNEYLNISNFVTTAF